MERVTIDGRSIAFRRAGAGPPLLLLHGAVCDGRVWREQVDSLADTFTVVAWDAPGCGGSDDPTPSFRMPDYADCLAGFVGALGLDRPHVLGHSWGSTLALELFRRHPSIPASLLLVGAYAGWAGSLPAEEVARRLDFARRTAESLPGWDPTTMPGLFSDAISPERAAELAGIMAEIRPAGTLAMAHALAEADERPVLGTIDVPTLIVNGDRDERSSLDVATALQEAIPGSQLAVLPGCGHECPLEDPAGFERAIRTFLARL